jgi:hypothetical protein
MKIIYTLLLLSLALVSRAESVVTEFPCGDTKVVTEKLREVFKEIPIIVGITNDNANSLMSLWTNVNNGSWTLVATKDQLSCIIGTGKSLRVVELGKVI